MTTMANLIGLQIAGRDPGYTTFLSIDWSGERLADSSDRALSTGDVYHTVKFEREYWTYESVVCNFLGSDNREAFIKIGLRLPARTVLADAAGLEVSPVDILAKIRSVLADNNLKRRADRYVLDSAKTFDSAVYKSLITGLTIRPFWGPALCMDGDRSPAYILAENGTAASIIGRLPMCMRLGEASAVNVGQFRPEVPLFAMTSAELDAAPKITIVAACKDVSDKDVELASAVVLNSSDYGYASDAYKNVAVELSRVEVLEAYASGRAIERRGATVKFDGNSGEVLVAFSPELCRKNIMVELEGIAANDNKAAVMCELSLGDISLSPGAFQLEGERITQFESAVKADRKWLLKHLRLKPASAYRIVDAALSGDTLRIVLAPLSVAVPNGSKMAESGTAVLSMLVPLSAKWAEKPCPVEIRQTPAGHNPECVRVCSDYYPEVMFEQNDDVRVARLSFVPSPSSRVEVFVGVPCRVSTEALQEASSAGAERYTADFGGGSVVKNSAFARFCGVFAFRDGERLPVSWFALRIFVITLIAVIILLGGMLAGWYYSDGIDAAIGTTSEAVQPEAADCGKQAPVLELKSNAESDESA